MEQFGVIPDRRIIEMVSYPLDETLLSTLVGWCAERTILRRSNS